ncbi:PHB depolymerase family esterase [Nonomuraea sp. NPDC005501]|uniref:alpha/beta hydrolase family esterase n=1 Tax=Nonomuraea sp. NPDC005501 TaxID=3156884 RepID=UPI0033B6019D
MDADPGRRRSRAGRLRRFGSALLCGALLVAAGCSGGGGDPSASPSPSRTSPTPSSSPSLSAAASPGVSATAGGGCAGGGPALRQGRNTIDYGGLRRVYLLALPRGRGPHPVLLDLHGLGSDAAQQAAYSRLPREGARRGYLVITPQTAEGRIGWTLPHAYGPDDTGFLTALLERVERGACVDRRRVFAAGMSFGAGMSAALACAMNGRLAGVAAVAGLSIVPPCERPAPLTLLAFHGTADQVVPYEGGHPFQNSSERRGLARLVVLPPVQDSAKGWARALGCTGDVVSAPAPGVRLRRWTGCRGGASVRLYTLRGAGHTWPGPIEVRRLGSTSRELDATKVILDVFDAAAPR